MNTPNKPVTRECRIHWLVPSSLYVGSWVPRWETAPDRDAAIRRARFLIDSGKTDSVTLRSTEVIR